MLKWFILFMLVFICALCYQHKQRTLPKNSVIDFKSEQTKEIQPNNRIEQIIKQVNDKNNKINSLEAQAIIQADGAEISAELFYKQSNNFRMLFYGLTKVNLDIGSNDNIFWFWSKQYNKNTLYYAKNEEYSNTRLKTPFNPIWIRGSLGIGEVTGDKFKEDDKFIKLYREDTITNGRQIIRAVMIDKSKLCVVGTYIYTTAGELLISSEWNNNNLNINWYEENQSISIKFKTWEVNKNINTKFSPPNKKNKVDMAKM